VNTPTIVGIYLLALLSQMAAAAYAMHLYFHAHAYRLAFGLLAIALGLMIGGRILPLLNFYQDAALSPLDAILALLISLLILLGFTQFKKILLDLEEKNFVLDRSSKIDSLTNALSRSETFARAEIEILRSLRGMQEVSFLMLDIDHFKNVNDQYGHQIGDTVLTNLVKSCQQQLRSIDIFGRVGGEEFFVVLPESSKVEAYQAAERMRQYVSITPAWINPEQQILITISIGISTFNPRTLGDHEPAGILRLFFNRADIAMYRAKQNGRNRIEVED
jgi:diguanylate cyclase (GGDEF)-like protein